MRYEVWLVVGTCNHPQARLPFETQLVPLDPETSLWHVPYANSGTLRT